MTPPGDREHQGAGHVQSTEVIKTIRFFNSEINQVCTQWSLGEHSSKNGTPINQEKEQVEGDQSSFVGEAKLDQVSTQWSLGERSSKNGTPINQEKEQVEGDQSSFVGEAKPDREYQNQ